MPHIPAAAVTAGLDGGVSVVAGIFELWGRNRLNNLKYASEEQLLAMVPGELTIRVLMNMISIFLA